MQVRDEARAEHYLAHLNYYRLAAYWLPYEADHGSHTFHPGTQFETVLDHYLFDRELRLLMLDAIERIEVSLRGHFAYQLGHRHGPHALSRPRCLQTPTGGTIGTGWPAFSRMCRVTVRCSSSTSAHITMSPCRPCGRWWRS
ncbi:Abi family protein [Kushneria aurantia]